MGLNIERDSDDIKVCIYSLVLWIENKLQNNTNSERIKENVKSLTLVWIMIWYNPKHWIVQTKRFP